MPGACRAPEVLSCPVKKNPDDAKLDERVLGYGASADVWALGALTYHILAGQPPYWGKTPAETADMIQSHGSRETLSFPRS